MAGEVYRQTATHKGSPMALTTLKPRLGTATTSRVRTMDTKAGATEMERGRAWMAKRQRVALAHGYKCATCKRLWVPTRDQIDHRIPREQGGSNNESNLQALCNECHKAKTDAEAVQRARGY
ncbi:HNH endonuclease [Variovorax sp. RT4R15]|uniref:HNH endonuclease n=1 Tax=Variovorax sp. RT4R15 TaxID=3443737 RepID=UPI003F4539F6